MPGADGLYVLDLDGMDQSAVDLADPTRLVFDYVRRIGDVLDRRPAGPLRVLHVGGAAMTLPRYVAATRPRSAQIVLEPDQQVIERVRAEAPLPPRSGIKVRPVDGLNGIAAVRDDAQDVVVVDAFRDAVVPAELATERFFAEVARVLAPGGVLVMNVTDRAPFALVRDVVAGMRATVCAATGEIWAGAEPATMKAKRQGNVVLLAGAAGPAPFGEPSPTAYRVFDPRAVSDSFGGGRPG
jgi:spermidine synthase